MATRKNEKPKKVVVNRSDSSGSTSSGEHESAANEVINPMVVGSVPAMAEGNLMIATTHALSNQAQDMTQVSQNADIFMHMSTIENLKELLK